MSADDRELPASTLHLTKPVSMSTLERVVSELG